MYKKDTRARSHTRRAIMVLFTCTALRFKQPTTISFASLTSLSRERRRQKKLSPGKKATQNRLDWVLGTTRFARGFSFFERAKRASRDFSLVVSLRGRARGVGFLPFAPPALVAPVETRELRESLSFELSLMPRQQKEHHPQSVLFKACDSCFSTPAKEDTDASLSHSHSLSTKTTHPQNPRSAWWHPRRSETTVCRTRA